ncbi:hypothetical protein Naga_100104g23 [Nannochloropsis gaditana]|uniref:Uncharacterized protein n=1 Tax=Nannochloropsis gaditana TaxID=72520 RepID=W7TW08_9STRA|nr:hypothetical protein Naga_100104g23 [Nannochloropsis gaditana]
MPKRFLRRYERALICFHVSDVSFPHTPVPQCTMTVVKVEVSSYSNRTPSSSMGDRAVLVISVLSFCLIFVRFCGLFSDIEHQRLKRIESDQILQTTFADAAMNKSSCLWINFMDYGRSGNRLI